MSKQEKNSEKSKKHIKDLTQSLILKWSVIERKKHYHKNKESILKSQREYYLKNRDKVREIQRQYYQKRKLLKENN